MKKVKILTYHCAMNVGAVLQCYALSTYLKNTGVDVEVIDYRDPKVVCEAIEQIIYIKKNDPKKYFKSRIRRFIKTSIKFLCGRCGVEGFKPNTPQAFENFVSKKLPLTSTSYYSKEELSNVSEDGTAFLVGSDQVWNPDLSANPEIYFLEFLKEGKKMAYAASFGKANITKECKDLVLSNLSSFNYISVREEEGSKIVKELIGRDCLWVMDPVFLLTERQWKRLMFRRPIKEQYILIYRMEDNELFRQEVQQIKIAEPNLKVVVFDYIEDGLDYDVFVKCKGPLEFISYIYYCKYMITNSFHGTAFSIIFSKEGIVIPHKTLNNRIASIMSLIDVKQENGIYHLYGSEMSKLNQSIQQSKDFLKTALS